MLNRRDALKSVVAIAMAPSLPLQVEELVFVPGTVDMRLGFTSDPQQNAEVIFSQYVDEYKKFSCSKGMLEVLLNKP